MTTATVSTAEAVHERLTLEGGWLCASELATIMAASETTIARTLYRLRKAGRVVNRQVELAYGERRQVDCRTEWRAL